MDGEIGIRHSHVCNRGRRFPARTNNYFATSVLSTGELPPASWQQWELSLISGGDEESHSSGSTIKKKKEQMCMMTPYINTLYHSEI